MADGQSLTARGGQINVTTSAPSHHANSTIGNVGLEIVCVGNANGTHSTMGLKIDSNGADTNTGLYIDNQDGGKDIHIVSSADANDYCSLSVGANGATTLSTIDNSGVLADLTLDIAGDMIVNVDGGGFTIKDDTHSHFFFDCDATAFTIYDDTQQLDLFKIQVAANGTTISTQDWELSGDSVDADLIFSADGHVEFDNCAVGFDRLEATFSTTGEIGSGGSDDTDIDFRLGNKYRLEMTADMHTMNLIFPGTSGNFTLVCTTNGDHDVSYWKVFESDESAGTTADVMWAGGSVPAFTSSGVDIVSFYWDADEQQAYGVASLAFATP